MKHPLTIHVGLPKCGSSSMQQGLWNLIPELDFVGPDFAGLTGEQIINRVLTLEELQYRQGHEEIALEAGQRFCGKRTTLISNERLTQGPASFPTLVPFGDRARIAHRLKELFPEARILLVLRNQFPLLMSLFGERLKGPHVAHHSFGQWFALQKANQARGMGSFFDVGDYYPLFSIYRELFGPENIKTVLFEEFVESPEEFHRNTLAFMGLEWEHCKQFWRPTHENSRVSHLELVLQKLMWRFPRGRELVPRNIRRSVGRTSRKFLAIRPTYTDDQTSFLTGVFAEGNAHLALETGLPLERHGYPLA